MACSSSRESRSRSLRSLLLWSLIAAAAVTPSCSAAPAQASRLKSSDREQVKDVEAAGADIADAAEDAASANAVVNPDGTTQTLIDELFSGTWGAFILKERPARRRSMLSPPPAEYAVDETIASTVAADDDIVVDGIGRDHPTSVEAQLLLDELPTPDADDDVEVNDDVIPGHDDAEAADRHGMAADVATGSSSSSGKEVKHSGALVHHRRGGGSPHPGKAFASSAVTTDRAAAGVRSHWRRGHDRATVNQLRNAMEPGDDVQQSAAVSLPPKQQHEVEEEEPRLHHVVAFHVTEAEPEAGVLPGEGGQQEHHKSSTAAAASVDTAGSLPTSERLADHGLPIGHWGKFLPSVSEVTPPRRTPAVAGGNHDGEHWGRTAPSRASRSRRPPSHEGKLSQGNSSGTIAAMPSFQLVRVRPVASVGSHANRDAAGTSVIAGGTEATDEDLEQRQQQQPQHQPVANAGSDDGAKHSSHANGHEGRLSVNHRVLADSSPLPTREGTRSGIAVHRASIGSGGVRAAGEGAVAAGSEHMQSPPTSRWTLRGSGQRQQQGPAGLGGWQVEDGWVAGDASSRPVASATVSSRPVRIDRPRSRVMLEGRFVA